MIRAASDSRPDHALREHPPTPAGDGRDAKGRFTAGNRCGRGNSNARKVQQLRQALLEAVSEEDLKQIVAALVCAAKQGETVAAREVLDRTIGKPVQTDFLQRLEALEALVEEYSKG